MGRQKPNKPRRPRSTETAQPSFPEREMHRLALLWDQAIDAGLMADGTDVNYRATPDGNVLSDAIGANGQLLVDGRELTAEWAAELRQTKPAFVGLIDTFEETNGSWTPISQMGPCEHSTSEAQ